MEDTRLAGTIPLEHRALDQVVRLPLRFSNVG
jgi:hypothetical protein